MVDEIALGRTHGWWRCLYRAAAGANAASGRNPSRGSPLTDRFQMTRAAPRKRKPPALYDAAAYCVAVPCRYQPIGPFFPCDVTHPGTHSGRSVARGVATVFLSLLLSHSQSRLHRSVFSILYNRRLYSPEQPSKDSTGCQSEVKKENDAKPLARNLPVLYFNRPQELKHPSVVFISLLYLTRPSYRADQRRDSLLASISVFISQHTENPFPAASESLDADKAC